MVGRLVEDQEVGVGEGQFGEGHAAALAAAQVTQLLVDVVAGEEHPGEEVAGHALRHVANGAHFVYDGVAGVETLVGLGIVAELTLCPSSGGLKWWQLTHDRLEKGGLARAVGAMRLRAPALDLKVGASGKEIWGLCRCAGDSL